MHRQGGSLNIFTVFITPLFFYCCSGLVCGFAAVAKHGFSRVLFCALFCQLLAAAIMICSSVLFLILSGCGVSFVVLFGQYRSVLFCSGTALFSSFAGLFCFCSARMEKTSSFGHECFGAGMYVCMYDVCVSGYPVSGEMTHVWATQAKRRRYSQLGTRACRFLPRMLEMIFNLVARILCRWRRLPRLLWAT